MAGATWRPAFPAALSRKGLTTIFGSNLGPASSPVLTFPLQNTLGGVSVGVSSGSTVINAIPIFVSRGQINAIMPSNTPLGMASLKIVLNNESSNPVPIRITDSSFGIFTANSVARVPEFLPTNPAAD